MTGRFRRLSPAVGHRSVAGPQTPFDRPPQIGHRGQAGHRTPLGHRTVAGALVVAALWTALTAVAPTPARAVAGRPRSTPAASPAPLTGGGVWVGPRQSPLPSGLDAQGWLLADLDTGAVLAARDAHGQFLPASTIKILTALATLPTLPPSRSVVISNHDASVDGSRVGLVPGVRYSVRELATAMLLASGNDAATALAEAAGGQASTLRAMNALARTLGADDTRAVDPTGLDAPGQVTSAYDLAVFARAALAAPAIRPYLTLRSAKVRGRGKATFAIQNHNELLGSYPGLLGVKNGYTVAANATYVGAARRGGHTLVVTLLDTRPDYAPEARALLDWGFAHRATARPVGWLPKPTTAPPPASRSSSGPRGRTQQPSASSAGGHSGGHATLLTWLAVAVTFTAVTATGLRARAL
ncbi:MAG: D-alanyl-D-alanine carboxypeptidase family protein, partial [Frankia sp.]